MCTGCDKIERIEYVNGAYCTGLVEKPERLCDEIRFCQLYGEEIAFSLDLAPDEVASLLCVLSSVLGTWLVQKKPRPCSPKCELYDECKKAGDSTSSESPATG